MEEPNINTENYDEWNEIKKSIQENNKILPFREREVWWYAAGKNIGTEINGKGARFSRPILIIRKYGQSSFLGIPLSTQLHQGRWYTYIDIKKEKRCVLLSQVGSFSAKRLLSRIGKISVVDFEGVCGELGRLIFKK